MATPRLRKRKDLQKHQTSASSRALSVWVITTKHSSNQPPRGQVLTDEVANNTRDDFSRFRARPPYLADVVLMDMDNPSMDGCRLATRLRSGCLTQDGLIIGLSTQVNADRRRECTKAGVNLLLLKPFDPEIIDTLLMLECIRVKRLSRDGKAQWQFTREPINFCDSYQSIMSGDVKVARFAANFVREGETAKMPRPRNIDELNRLLTAHSHCLNAH